MKPRTVGSGQRTREQDDADHRDIFGAPLPEEEVAKGSSTFLSSRPSSSGSGDAQQVTARGRTSSPAHLNARGELPVSLIAEPGRAPVTGRDQLSLLEGEAA